MGRRPARATRWVAGARPIRSEQDNSSPPAESSNERRRVAARRQPGRRTARLCEPQEHSQQVQPYRLSGSKPAGFGVEAGIKRRCASLRGGRLRPARLCEPQKHSQKHGPIHNPNLWHSACRPSPRAAKPLGDKAGDSANRAIRSQPKARPSSPPRVRLLGLRCRSAAFLCPFFVRALAEILLEQFTIVLTISFSSNRARSSFVPSETALRGRRPANKAKTTLTKRPMGAPAGRSDTAYRLISSAQFFIRAPRLKERASVLREGTALGPRGPHVPWTGNAYAFPLAASTPILCPRALGKSCQNVPAHFDDFPPKAWRAIWLLPRLVLFSL